MDTQTELLVASEVRFQRARLVVVGGPDAGLSVSLEGQTVVVGTDSGCELKVVDQSVSRRHLELAGGPNGFRLRDLRSTNGVLVDGLKVLDCILLQHATLTLGRTTLRFDPDLGEVQWPLSASDRFGEVWGASVTMRRLFALLERISTTQVPVAFEAEAGLEVQALARELHRVSGRGERPFVVLDALVGDLREALAECGEGTCFIDSVQALSPPEQRLLAKTIEAGREGVGPRIIVCGPRAPASLDLQPSLAEAVGGLVARVPPLRERDEDVVRLSQNLASQVLANGTLNEPQLALVRGHDWRGNWPELRAAVERLVLAPEAGLAALGERLGPRTDVGLAALIRQPYHAAKEAMLEHFEKAYVLEHLTVERGNVTKAAARMQLPRQTVYRLLSRHGLTPNDSGN